MSNIQKRSFRWVYMPYCLNKLSDGRYIVLNSDYKPLGYSKSEFVNYQDHPSAQNIKITKSTAKKLSYCGDDDIESIMLYNDGCTPTRTKKDMDSYLEKLEVLSSLTLEMEVK